MIDRLRIDGEPVPKGRPRFSCIKGKPHTYTPAKTLAAEQELAWHFRSAHTGPPVAHPVALRVAFHVKSNTCDLDNLIKTILDAANGIVFEDDKQVVQIEAELYRGSKTPHTDLTFREIQAMQEAA
jgi:Holliday junction resolvase RusA-like endonuclease